MLDLQITSDLHIESLNTDKPINHYIIPAANILVLAGDIGRIHKFQQLKSFLTRVCKLYRMVIYVPGNHEYYKVPYIYPKGMDELFYDLKKIKTFLPNLFILKNSWIVIDNYCIAGCTLWSYATEIPPYIVRIKNMTLERYNEMFFTDVEFIKSMIDYSRKNNLKLIMITHHCPSFSVLRPDRVDNPFKFLYNSNLDYLLQKNFVDTWIYGHTHYNVDVVTEGGTRMVCNQKGKERENISGFLKDKVIRV